MQKIFWPLPVILGLFFSVTISAQKNKQAIKNSYPEFSLRTSLTSYIDYDAGIMLGINYRWSKNFSASFEPTWIFYNGLVTNRDEKIFPSGIKIRADLRYYFPKRSNSGPDFFIAPEFHYKSVKTEKEDRFGINCQNGQCAYFQDAVYTEQKKEIGGLLKAGLMAPLSFIGKKDRWLIEIYGGFGVKQLKFKETHLPIGGSFVNPPNRAFFSLGNRRDRNTYSILMLPAGIKLVFVFK